MDEFKFELQQVDVPTFHVNLDSPHKYCSNCKALITCGCQYRTSSDGKQVCDACLIDYEESIEKFKSYVESVKSYVDTNKLDGKYCIALYSYQGEYQNPINKTIQHVYKSIEDFEVKALNNIDRIEKSLGVDFQVCIYE